MDNNKTINPTIDNNDIDNLLSKSTQAPLDIRLNEGEQLIINDPNVIRQKEIHRKQKELWEASVESKYQDLEIRKNQHESIKNINLCDSEAMNKHITKAIQDNEDYFQNSRKALLFINPDFADKVPCFTRNFIMVAAKTGDGKSTATANLAYNWTIQNKKILIITNEERVCDCYNRISCLCKGWSYVNHDKFSDSQHQEFNRLLPILSQRVTVVDDNFTGQPGQTTTLEGIVGLLDSLIKNKNNFDAIIIDYYQNIARSVSQPYLKVWEVQEKIAHYLDKFMDRYPAPIILMAMLKTENDKKLDFKEALEGRKMLLDKVTCAVRLVADRENQRTAWEIKKSRFTSALGQTVYTGFDRGKYVPYTPQFASNVELKKDDEKVRALINKKFED